MNIPFVNWRTSSFGSLAFVAGAIHLIYGIIHKNLSEGDAIGTVMGMLTGAGLLAARDSKASQQAIEQHEATIEELRNKLDATTEAVKSNDTSIITKAEVEAAQKSFETPAK